MISSRRLALRRSLILGLLGLSVLAALCAPAARAQTATPAPATPTITGTPVSTRTPAPTPTATATLTELQNRLLLADTYLKGGRFATAIELYTEILTQERGQPEALAGLKKALEGQAAGTATAQAPRPTVAPMPPVPEPSPSLSGAFSSKIGEVLGTALPLLGLGVVLYLLTQVLRWGAFLAREAYYLKVRPLLHRPALGRPFLIDAFTDATGLPDFHGAEIVPHRITEKLLAWNQLLQAKTAPVMADFTMDLDRMAWIKILWTWLLPPARGFRVEGFLTGDQPGAYRLAVRRTDLSTGSLDASHTFESTKAVPEAAFREMADLAAKWLSHPRDIEASDAAMRGVRTVRGVAAASPLSASEVYDEVLDLLLPVRQQVNQAAIDFADAHDRLRQAEVLLQDLPRGGSLFADLQAVIADLRRNL